jgi:hypothetical protein
MRRFEVAGERLEESGRSGDRSNVGKAVRQETEGGPESGIGAGVGAHRRRSRRRASRAALV